MDDEQHVVEAVADVLKVLDPVGRILYVSPSVTAVTGHEVADVSGQSIGDFLHSEDVDPFTREFNESITTGVPMRFFYRFRHVDGSYVLLECTGHAHVAPTDVPSSTMDYRGFFISSRPYVTPNNMLLDSLLEHKMENERLMKRIAELKQQEADDRDEELQSFLEQQERPGASTNVLDLQPMGPPKPPLTRENLDSALSVQKPDSIADKMSRFETSNHYERIELLTGLQYRDGERSVGISTGDADAKLIHPAGTAPTAQEPKGKEKRRARMADEYVCSDCGTLDSPEWRKGPKGPKTLCNACGLRWAKREKKKGEES